MKYYLFADIILIASLSLYILKNKVEKKIKKLDYFDFL